MTAGRPGHTDGGGMHMRTGMKIALCVLLALFAAASLTAVLADIGAMEDRERPAYTAERAWP